MPVSFGTGSSTTQTTTRNIPAPSNMEGTAQGLSYLQVLQQLGLLDQAAASQGVQPAAQFDEQAYLAANPDVAQAVAAGQFPSGLAHYQLHGQGEIAAGRRAQLPTPAPSPELAAFQASQAQGQQVNDLATQSILNRLQGQTDLMPAQQARIDQVYGNLRKQAMADLDNYGLQLAQSRGMNVTDSPVASILMREGSRLGENLAARQAQDTFNIANQETQFAQAQRDFQERLKQNIFANRTALAQVNPAQGLSNNLANQRIASAGTQTQQSSNPGVSVNFGDTPGFIKGIEATSGLINRGIDFFKGLGSA